MELLNLLNNFNVTTKLDQQLRQEVLDNVILMLSPIVPHITHTLWFNLGHTTAVIEQPWPTVDSKALSQDTIGIVIQVNGKLRANLTVAADINKADLEQLAMQHESIQKYIVGKELKKIILVPRKLVNIVVGE